MRKSRFIARGILPERPLRQPARLPSVLHPQEVALLSSLVRAGRLTQDGARAFAQGLEARRAAGERPSLVEALVQRRVATADEIARAIKSPSDRQKPPLDRPGPPLPFRPEPDAPTVRNMPGTANRPDSFIN